MTALIPNHKEDSSQTREPLDNLFSVGQVPPRDHYSAMQEALSSLQPHQVVHLCSQQPVSLEAYQLSHRALESLQVKMLLISRLQLLPPVGCSAFSLVLQEGYSIQIKLLGGLSSTHQLPYSEVRTPCSVD